MDEKIEITYNGDKLEMNTTLDTLKTLFVIDLLRQNIMQDLQKNAKITQIKKPIIEIH